MSLLSTSVPITPSPTAALGLHQTSDRVVHPQEEGSGSNLHRPQKVQAHLDMDFQGPGPCNVAYMGSMGPKGQVPLAP